LQQTGIPFLWSCLSRADVVTEDLLERMFRAGCREMQMGIESASPEILGKLGKGVSREQIENALRLAQEFGFVTNGSIILGHPWDTLDTMKLTVEFALDLRDKYGVSVYAGVNTPFPGTYQYEHAAELGIRIHTSRWNDFRPNNPIISTPHFSLDELRELYFHTMELI
jgi:radical SAM superfamily enzyme YgiQ (UPF0313 family)